MNLPFTKMQGLGNDFVVLSAADLNESGGSEVLAQWQEQAPIWAKILCDRHFGIGADGLIVLFDLTEKRSCKIPAFVRNYPQSEGTRSPYAWTYTNADGSWSSMCGNGLRCAALYLREHGFVDPTGFSLSTAVGAVPVQFVSENLIETDFGVPVLNAADIPTGGNGVRWVRETLPVQCFDTTYDLAFTAVNVGNPHCVIFDRVKGDKLKTLAVNDKVNLERLADFVQKSPLFPEGVNISFAEIVSGEKVNLQVYERGCGWTLACGSAAAATLVAGVLEGKLSRHCEIALPGGVAQVTWGADEHIRLCGPARHVFDGGFDTGKMADGALVANLREVVS